MRAVYVTEDVVLLCDMGVHSLEFALHWLQTMGWSPGENDLVHERKLCFLAVNEILMLEVTDQFLLKTVCNPIAKDPELTEGQGDPDGQERTSLMLDCSRPGLRRP